MDEKVLCIREKDRVSWLRELCQCAMTYILRTRGGWIMRQPIIYYIYDIDVHTMLSYCPDSVHTCSTVPWCSLGYISRSGTYFAGIIVRQ